MNQPHSLPPLIQVVGYAGSGKTTLLTRVVQMLTNQGWNVGTIKHHPKSWEWDEPGKDTWRHRQAGAGPVALVTGDRTVIDWHKVQEPVALLPFYRGMDLVLVEGFKQASHPKLVMVHREEDRELLDLSSIITLVSSQPEQWKKRGPCLHWDDVEKVAAMIVQEAGLDSK
ncbi:molybdopterin-guanine dinucleotide biosynthesis protein B [Desmospora profundinema]|uniref:Molybdopterin-guanine dinucleotide biosynthesis protein B n=1 Tax=Desmospora profundinema TaxID=1571184 RepID=A0ABU1IJ03_9BACL|nr:molybdopterin-guanine dinucleotide biosynthesis protein B [Desmospora profundinema]MDR6224738.1 molybdopterin-guanine dinucleotide biosynthesis protein B [Desmospora profundinema]